MPFDCASLSPRLTWTNVANDSTLETNVSCGMTSSAPSTFQVPLFAGTYQVRLRGLFSQEVILSDGLRIP